MWVRKLVMTVQKVQSSSMPCLVEDGINRGPFGCIEYESILFPVLDKVVLWGEKDVQRELRNPHWQWDNKHGLHNHCESHCNQRVVVLFPIGHKIVLQAGGIENVLATCGHDSAVVPQ